MYLLNIKLIFNIKQIELCSLLSGNQNSSIINNNPTRIFISLNFRYKE